MDIAEAAAIRAEYEAGAGLTALSLKHHLPRTHIRRIVVEAGGTMRKRGRPRTKCHEAPIVEREAANDSPE